MMKRYTTKDISESLGVSIRTIQRHIATLIEDLSNTDKKGVSVPQDVFDLLKQRQMSDTMATDERQSNDTENEEEFDYFEAFTSEEYIEFQKRINEYPILKEYIQTLKGEIEFLRFNTAQQNETIKYLSDSIKQRNFIEAKEKGIE